MCNLGQAPSQLSMGVSRHSLPLPRARKPDAMALGPSLCPYHKILNFPVPLFLLICKRRIVTKTTS